MRNITVDIMPKKKVKHALRWWQQRYVWLPLLSLLLLLTVLGGLVYWRMQPMIASATSVMDQVNGLKSAAKAQDLKALDTGLPELQRRLDVLDNQIKWFGFTQYIPLLGAYYQDSQHIFNGAEQGIVGGKILIKAVEPYADVLGLKGATVGPAKPTDARVAELTLLMPSLLPSLDEAQGHFESLKKQMDAIDPGRYPGKIGQVNVRQLLTDAKGQVTGLESGIHQVRPLLAILPQVMGAPDAKKYLILFQNDKELRPTGGFITSVAYLTFNKGKFQVGETGDIYTIDKDKAYLPLPAPISTYLKVPQWNMRDTNFSPDFAQSMHDFEYYYTKSKDPAIDGIIAVDTQFVEGLMEMTGPLTVPGYKQQFSAAPINVNGTSVPQVVYQLEVLAEKSGLGGDARKSILGDLMQQIIKKILSDPATRWPSYVAMLQKQGQQKHILLSFHDAQAQSLAEDQNFAGRIVQTQPLEDYLHINDANLAGLKSNFYLTQQTKQEVMIAGDGSVHEKLTIVYANTGKFDGWINATARNYTRVYVPAGSTLTKSSGGDQKVTTSTDLGKTVFDNFVLVKPLQSRTVTFEYTLPFKVSSYKELIQKQPGAKNWDYTVIVNGQSQRIVIDKDTTITSKK
jgi:hypothetical protein